MAPCKKGLEELLKVCEKFSEDYKVKFNASKSQFIIFHGINKKPMDTGVVFGGSKLDIQDHAIHLGHKIFANLKYDDVDGVLACFYKQVNMCISRFRKIPSSIRVQLFLQHCSSLYGFMLLNGSSYKKIEIAWRKSLRRVWNLPYQTHCNLLTCLMNGCAKHMLIGRFLDFAASIMCHDNSLIRYVGGLALRNKLSVLGKNVKLFADSIDMTEAKVSSQVKKLCVEHCQCNTLDRCHAELLQELCQMRDNIMNCELSKVEINDIIYSICLN